MILAPCSGNIIPVPIIHLHHLLIHQRRRKGGRQPGPYRSVAWQIGMPTLPNPAAVLAEIEVLKADTAAQAAELKGKKPDIRIPEIKWRFARRNGKFQSQLSAIRR